MTNTQHTPGPWSYSEGTRTIRGPQNHWLASMDSWDGAIDHAANARLIAAAPCLLDALRGLLDFEPPLLSAKERKAYAIARAAIAKATGQ